MLEKEQWINLIKYYIACLDKEMSQTASFNTSKYNNEFISNFSEYEEFIAGNNNNGVITLTEEQQRFIKKIFYTKRQGGKLFYGYPLLVYQKKSRAGKTYNKVLPLFTTEVRYTFNRKSGVLEFEKVNSIPEFNVSVLSEEHYSPDQRYDIYNDVSNQFSNFEGSFDFEFFLDIIGFALDQTRFSIGNMDNKLDFINFESLVEEKVCNQSILYWGETNFFQKDLLDELNVLAKDENYENIKKSGINHICNTNPNVSDGIVEIPTIYSILPLDKYQKKAVKEALSQNFTVISGPPGTGKSQTIINIIINAVINGKSVLFASKNNQAVDVVYQRINDLTPNSMIIRTGNNEYREVANSQIKKASELITFSKETEDNKTLIEDVSEIADKNIFLEELMNKRIEMEKEKEKLTNKLLNTKLSDTEISKIETSYTGAVDSLLAYKKIYNKLINGSLSFIEGVYSLVNKTLTKNGLVKTINKLLIKHSITYDDIENFEDLDMFFNHIERVADYIECINRIKDIDKNLDKIPITNNLINEIKEGDRKIQENSLKIYEHSWKNKFASANTSLSVILENYIEAQKFFDKKTRLTTIDTDKGSDYFNQMLSVLPIWGVTNLSAKKAIPFKNELFDYVIIDEASQCDIPSVLPLLYRGKKVVIIGDIKQLPNITTIKDTDENKFAEENNVKNDTYLKYNFKDNSLYSLSDKQYRSMEKVPTVLRGHYRSHPDIINYCNIEYYEATPLEILTEERNHLVNKPGIYWLDCPGNIIRTASGSSYNEEEASTLIDLLKTLILENGHDVSYGIITPFRKQVELVQNMVIKLIDDLELDDTHLLDVAVDTVWKYQGDEKDIILFTPVVTESAYKKTTEWVDNNDNLMNVTVSRAKELFITVGDFNFAQRCKGNMQKLSNYINSLGNLITNEQR